MTRPWLLPLAIIGAGLIIGVAIFVVRYEMQPHVVAGTPDHARALTPQDHLMGNPTAPIVIIEYCDMDDPYCKTFGDTLQTLMTAYGPSGNVALAYRHFPIIGAHPNSAVHAQAAECAASIGGPGAFWSFVDTLEALAAGDMQFDPNDYSAILPKLHLDPTAFKSCLDKHPFDAVLREDYQDALAAGADGVPYTVIAVRGEKPVSISGTVPYDTLKTLVDQAISRTVSR